MSGTVKNFPKEPGLYWASLIPMGTGYELIATITGTRPFFKCKAWDYFSHIIKEFYNPGDLYFGPRIELIERDPRARKLKK